MRVSRHKSGVRAKMCLDKACIETEISSKSKDVSRLGQNRDINQQKEQRCVPIKRVSRHKSAARAKLCPDKARIET